MDSREDETTELPRVPGQGALDPGATLDLGLPGALPHQIGGHRIIRELGRGGMGVVYEAEQLSLKRRVALKVMSYGALSSVEVRCRFQREAETAAQLHHTNVVPILEVGEDRGLHYFTMQLIEGEDLAARIARCERRPPDRERLREAARLGLQAAEALAYAHDRGVIHRDIKPSNLLIDNQGTLWVSDFGLAKHASDASLTLSGLVLGTPSYMSPEQARGRSEEVIDGRTDIYSLGVSLYEYIVGTPAFHGTTPERVIAAVLETTPPAPRRLWKNIPLDLETIIIKATAKSRDDRYATAAALAADLRAFLEGRPVIARRLSRAKRAARWLRRHRKVVGLAGGAAAAALLVVVAVNFAGSALERWREGRLVLETKGLPLAAELVDRDGRRLGVSFPVPTAAPVAAPAGVYQLRLFRQGLLAEPLDLEIERGGERRFTLPQALWEVWEPFKVRFRFEVARLEGSAGGLVLSPSGIRFLRGSDLEEQWFLPMDPQRTPALAMAPGFAWRVSELPSQIPAPRGMGDFARAAELVDPVPDLNGDGASDIVFVFRHQAALLAISGRDGKPLWARTPWWEVLKEAGFSEEGMTSSRDKEWLLTGTALGFPVMLDAEGDGQPDLILAFIQRADLGAARNKQVWRWVEAFSGPTGATVWRRPLAAALFNQAGQEGGPEDARWAPVISHGIDETRHRVTLYGPVGRQGGHRPGAMESLSAPFGPQAASRQGSEVVYLTAGRFLLALDPRTGKDLLPPRDLGYPPVRAPLWADLDADGSAEAILLREVPEPDGAPPVRLALEVLGEDLKPLWRAEIEAEWRLPAFYEGSPAWPLIEDFDGDGKPDVVAPSAGAVKVFTGAGGGERLSAALVQGGGEALLGQPDRFLTGPDIDGDGFRELFAASLRLKNRSGGELGSPLLRNGFPAREIDPGLEELTVTVQAQAFSGKDGGALWTQDLQTVERPSDIFGLRLDALHLWGPPRKEDRLLVSFHQGPARVSTYLLSAVTGERLAWTEGLRKLETADLDGDGCPELLSFTPDDPMAYNEGGTVHTSRYEPEGAWRRLGGRCFPAQDYDGDGRNDLLVVETNVREGAVWARQFGSRPVVEDEPAITALSGLHGGAIWTQACDHGGYDPRALPPGQGDLDGDGTADFLTTRPLIAFSGRSGAKLWTSTAGTAGFSGSFPFLEADLGTLRDLDGDGTADLLIFAQLQEPSAAELFPLVLRALSGRLGSVLWEVRAAEGLEHGVLQPHPTAAVRPAYGDLNGDGAMDVAVAVLGGPPRPHGPNTFVSSGDRSIADWPCFLLALEGRSGRRLWLEPLTGIYANVLPQAPIPVASDLDGDGRLEVLVTEPSEDAMRSRSRSAMAFRGGDGKLLFGTQLRGGWSKLGTSDDIAGRNRPYPLPVRLEKGGGSLLCVWDHYPPQVFLLDTQGQVVEERGLEFAQGKGHLLRVWSSDLDQDGGQELVFFEGRTLRAVRSGLSRPFWDLSLGDDAYIWDVREASAGAPPTVWVRTHRSFAEVDGGTGRLRSSFTLPAGLPVAFDKPKDGEWQLWLLDPGEALGAAVPVHRPASPAGSGPRFLAQLPGQIVISSGGVPRALPRSSSDAESGGASSIAK